MERTKPNWSNLPQDILCIIAKHLLLHSLDDTLRFRAVCKSFRSSSSFVFPSTPLIPRSSFRTFFSRDSIPGAGLSFLLAHSTVYAIEPLFKTNTHPWLVRIEESNFDSGKFQIMDPLLGFSFKNLSNKLPKSLNLLDHRVKEIAKAYHLVNKGKGKMGSIYLSKAVVSERLEIMAIHGQTRQLVMWKKEEEKGNTVATPLRRIQDIAYHNKKFYALGCTGRAVAIDSKTAAFTVVANRLPKLEHHPRHHTDCHSKHLIGWLMDLFLILKCVDVFVVFKLDEEKREWVRMMDGLEDKVFFVSDDCSFALSAKEFTAFHGNSIYCCYASGYPEQHVKVFEMNEGTYWFQESFPHCSKIFWPPPNWLNQPSGSVPS